MRIILIGRGKMGTLIRETAAAAGDEIEAVFGRDDLGQMGRLGRVADVVMDFSRPEEKPAFLIHLWILYHHSIFFLRFQSYQFA